MDLARLKTRQWGRTHREQIHFTWMKWKYGLESSEYLALIKNQGGVCAICQKPFPKKRLPTVDHCHQKKTVRGVLCVRCNTGLGMFGDDPDILHRAIAYITAH